MFDAWQAQQKAQKDQERKAKKDAAASLQGYRKAGLSEEETKLAALREQERLQKVDAEKALQGYRRTLTEDEAKLAAQKQEELRKKQEYEEQLRNNGVVSKGDDWDLTQNSGVVSALAAGYTCSPSKAKASPALSEQAQQSVAVETIPAPPEVPEASVQPESTPEVAPPATETPQVEPPAPASRRLYKSAAKFMFGILTPTDAGASPQDRSKLVEGYLARADEIAKSVIADNNYSSSSFETISLSMAYPTASSVKKDECK